MIRGLKLQVAAAAVVALAVPAVAAGPFGRHDAQSASPFRLVQAAPEAPAVPAPPPAEAAPAPMLPAPHMPGDDPVAELPPEGETAAPPVATGPGGIPITGNGAVFSFADLAERLLDSVVYISTSQRVAVSRRAPVPDADKKPPGEDFFDDFFDDDSGEKADPRTVQSLGSGFVIDASGYIVTNNHVIADADEIVANFGDGSKYKAEVIGIDDKTDLALLKVNATHPLKATSFGRSDRLRVGEWVLAIGNPFGFGGTVTAGIVSALDRDINSGPYDHYIQTDASINRGNSGGPLFNISGEVVGINTAIMSPTGGSIGIGFAVPSEIAVPVIEQLRRFGSVRRGWIGVRIQDVTDDVASGLGMAAAAGAMIAGLSDSGPAAKAGIKEGDVVVEFNGKPVKTMRDLPRIVADTPPGDTVDVVVMRDKERVTLKIEIGLLEDAKVAELSAAPESGKVEGSEKQNPPAALDAARMFGLTLGEITEEARKTFSIGGDIEGVLVTAVDPGSEAEEKSVKPGEVIVQVSQTDVNEPQEVMKRIEELKSEGRRSVMLLVSGVDKKMRFVSLRFEDPAQP